MHDAVAELYRWLVDASLRLCLVLPLLLAAAWISRRTASRIICVLLATGLATAILASVVPPLFRFTVPALAATRAFATDLPEGLRQAAASIPAVPPAGSLPGAKADSLPVTIAGIWAAGAFLALLWRGWQYISGLIRFARATPVPAEHPASLLLQRLGEGLKGKPWLFADDSVPGPMVHGLLHPRILVSRDFLRKDPAAQEMIFRHELAHLQKHDVPLRAVLEIGAILFWFHPLVHVLLRRYDQAVEMACDDAVLASGVPASRYGEALVEEAKQSDGGRRGVREVRSRLLAVLRADKRRIAPNPRTTASLAGLFAIALLPLALTGFSPYPSIEPFQPLAAGPQLGGLWRMRVGRGDVADDWSGFNRHGRILGATWVKDPQRGYCLSFDGKDDILILPGFDSNWTMGPVTIAMWLKVPRGADGGGLMLRGDFNQTWSAAYAHMGGEVYNLFGEREFHLCGRHGPDGGASTLSPGLFPTYDCFGIKDQQCSMPLHEDEWTHLAFTLTPLGNLREIRYYVNGELACHQLLDMTTAPTFNLDWPAEHWYFGRGESPPVHGNHFEGLLSDLAVFTVALSEEEIRKAMAGDFRSLTGK